MRTRTGWAGAAVALVATLAGAPAALAANAVYGGSTGGGEPIVITADKAGKALRSAVIAWRANCADGMYFSDGASLTPGKASPGFTPDPGELLMKRNAKRRFSGVQATGFDLGDSAAVVTVSLDGKLSPKAASGTLSADVTIIEKATGNQITTCSLARSRWKATRAPGRVYAGKTSQDEPVVARLDAKRKRITDLLVSWDSTSCQTPGYVHYGERLHNIDVAASGRFSDSWDATDPLSDGGTARTTYALAGRVAKRAARGTLRIGVTWLDAAGATTDSCDSGGVTWKATTG
jgi:hypothetical protein